MKNILSVVLLTLVVFSCSKKQTSLNEKSDSIDVKVDSLLALMTLDEKIGQIFSYLKKFIKDQKTPRTKVGFKQKES